MSLSRRKRLTYTDEAASIVSQMSLEEKVCLMTGDANLSAIREAWRQSGNFSYFPYPTKGAEQWGIRPLVFSDGPRGVVCGFRQTTCFPAPVLRAASFDTALEQSIGSAIAEELTVRGATIYGGVSVNVPYHPGWGRCQDTYGEDPFLIGQFGAALTKGVQKKNVMACAKHFAFNFTELSRFQVNVTCSRRTEQEVFLAPFRECVQADAAAVMTTYNRYNGEYCGENRYLLTDVLRGQWKFDGIVISDFFSSIHDTVRSAEAGLDLEMPIPQFYGQALLEAVKCGKMEESVIDRSAIRIVRTCLAFQNASTAAVKSGQDQKNDFRGHASLALHSAHEGITLLKNSGHVLPLNRKHLNRIAILGSLAKEENLGDHGSARVFPAHVTTILAGLSQALPASEIIYYSGSDLQHAARIAGEADAVIFVVGNSWSDEGEYMTAATSPDFRHTLGGDRRDLHLHPHDVELLRKVAPVNKNSVAVLIGGSTILMSEWIDSVPAVLLAYYPGQEGGTALADILTGKVNPSGKLPFVIPRRAEDLPAVDWDADEVHAGYYHGYTKLDKDGIRPLFPFGLGLSYTTFRLSGAEFSSDRKRGGFINASVNVTNTGKIKGTEVIQLYVGFDNSAIDRPHKLLRGFTRVSLKPGEQKRVSISCPIERLEYYDEASGHFKLESMTYQLYIGTSSDEQDLIAGEISLVSS